MRINILIPSTSSINTSNNGANVQGDELIARSWAKYFSKNSDIEFVHINGDLDKYDICISFSPLIQSVTSKAELNILYLQNVFPKPAWPGTVEMFHTHKHRYDAFVFPSNGLKQACGSDGLVCQFAVDPEIFYPDTDPNLSFNTCFVGNNIRDKNTTNDFILSAERYGLAIFGNPYSWNHRCCQGKISINDERKLYASSKICLNAHLEEHLTYGSFNFRIFNILACKGFVISDKSLFLENEFNKCMVFAENKADLLSKIEFYLDNPDTSIEYRENGYKHVLNNHTFKHRVTDILNWIKQL